MWQRRLTIATLPCRYIDKTGYIQTKINPNGIAPENQKLGFWSKDEARRDQMSIDIEVRARRRAPAARLLPLRATTAGKNPSGVPKSVLNAALPSLSPCPADGEVPPDHPDRDGIRGKVRSACRGEPDGGG